MRYQVQFRCENEKCENYDETWWAEAATDGATGASDLADDREGYCEGCDQLGEPTGEGEPL